MGNCKDCKCPRRRGIRGRVCAFRISGNGRASAAKRSVLGLSSVETRAVRAVSFFLSSAFGVLGGSASCLTMMCGGKHRFSACCRRRRRSAALAGAFVVRADCFCRSPRCQRLQRDSQDLGEQAATFNCETLFHCVAINSGARKALDTGVGSPQRMSVAMPKDSRFHCGVLSHKHPHGADWRQPAAAWSRAVLMQVRRL